MGDANSTAIFNGVFFENFLSISHYQTVLAIVAILACFYILKIAQNKKVDFSIRMLIGLALGAVLGLAIQFIAGNPQVPTQWMKESAIWYGLPGRAFIAFIRMLIIPLIFVSIVKVILDFSGKENLPKIAIRGIFWLLFTTGIAVLIGIILGNIFSLGADIVNEAHTANIREYKNIVDVIVNLIPNNIVSAMSGDNIVGLVIFSAMIGIAANRMEAKNPETIGIFKKFIFGFYKIVMSMAMTVIKLMPYAVIALLSRTIVSNGIPAIIEVSSFVAAIYIATAIMLLIHIVIVAAHGVSPTMYVKKAIGPWLMGFTSRSSVGTLPMTISTLTTRMGVNDGTANLVGSLGATIGMNGCAGFFPAMIVIMVANAVGIEINLQFYIMMMIVIIIGSIGIAGIPGTATVAATIALSGMGMAEYFPLIGMVLAIDPIIDMARTLTNVSGAMTAVVATDREVGTMNMEIFNDPDAALKDADNAMSAL